MSSGCGSTFEQVEDEAQLALEPAPDDMVRPTGVYSSVVTSFATSLSLLDQGTKPCDLLTSSSASLPPPTEGGRGPRIGLGDSAVLPYADRSQVEGSRANTGLLCDALTGGSRWGREPQMPPVPPSARVS